MEIESIKLEKLRTDLIRKIESEWLQKWQAHGVSFNGFDGLSSLNAFLEDILEDIEQTIKEKIGLKATAEILISKDSLRRFIQNPKLGAIKYKTRHTIAYYLGYEGWHDYEAKITPLLSDYISIENSPKNKFVKYFSKITAFFEKENNRKQSIIIIGVIFLLSIMTLIIKQSSFVIKDEVLEFKVVAQSETAYFPTAVKLSYNIKTKNIDNYYLRQHIEPVDWYLKKDTQVYKMPTNQGEKIVYCDKPGLHHIDLIKENKVIKTLVVPIRAKDWFGIIYGKDKNNPNEFIYSTPKDWDKIQDQYQMAANNGKKTLSVPPISWSNMTYNGQYRTDLFYSGDISIDVDELCMEVEVKSVGEEESFDCKYFQLGFIDTDGIFYYIYSPITTCSTQGYFAIYAEDCTDCFPYQVADALTVDTKKNTHTVKFYFKQNVAYAELDGVPRYQMSYKENRGRAEVFNISVNGASAIKHFKVSNTTTNATVYEEYFN